MEQAQLGKYLIESEIGRGAMGVVYKARDTVLERTVAVKTVNMALEKDHADKYEARFYQEAPNLFAATMQWLGSEPASGGA